MNSMLKFSSMDKERCLPHPHYACPCREKTFNLLLIAVRAYRKNLRLTGATVEDIDNLTVLIGWAEEALSLQPE